MELIVGLLDWCVSIFLCFLILRVYFQYAQVSFYHPLGDWILKLTNPLLKPVRQYVPHRWNWYGLDWAGIALSITLYWLWHGLSVLLQYGTVFGYFWPILSWFRSIPNALAGNLYAFLGMMLWMVLLQIILSWTSHQPLAWLEQATRPFLSIFRRFIPTFYGLDFSSWALLLCIQFVMSILHRLMLSAHLPPRGVHSLLGQLFS